MDRIGQSNGVSPWLAHVERIFLGGASHDASSSQSRRGRLANRIFGNRDPPKIAPIKSSPTALFPWTEFVNGQRFGLSLLSVISLDADRFL